MQLEKKPTCIQLVKKVLPFKDSSFHKRVEKPLSSSLNYRRWIKRRPSHSVDLRLCFVTILQSL